MNPTYNMWIIPSDIKRSVAKKYGVTPLYVIRLYYHFWHALRQQMKKNVYTKNKRKTKPIVVPYIGSFVVAPKLNKYLYNEPTKL